MKLVAGVGERKKANPDHMNSIMDEIHSISEGFVELLASKQSDSNSNNSNNNSNNDDVPEEWYPQLEKWIRRNHVLLNDMGVGHPSLDKVVEVTDRLSLASKLTGAGGGGCALTLIRKGIVCLFVGLID